MGDARRTLLAGLIDDAGLFPPAKLPMAAALESHFTARAGDERWILGRFLCPSSRVDELLAELPPHETLRLGVVVDTPELAPPADPRIALETVEVRAGDADAIASFPAVPASVYFEAPGALAEAAARRAAGLKIRCGGLAADAFPSPEAVASFFIACRAAAVPFKATAGLHHAIRQVDSETGFTHHGFVNLLGAAALACDRGVDAAELADVLADEDRDSFRLESDGLVWRGRHFDAAACVRARAFFVGFGSCSFSEPVEELRSLGVLPQTAPAA